MSTLTPTVPFSRRLTDTREIYTNMKQLKLNLLTRLTRHGQDDESEYHDDEINQNDDDYDDDLH